MYPTHAPETPHSETRHHAPELELRLLRAGVRRTVAQHPGCSRCRRSLLIGERFAVFEAGAGEHHLCALCLGDAPKRLGEIVRIERVRAGKGRLAVKRAA